MLVAVLITGCASRTYYHLSSAEEWDSYNSACTGPIELYEREVGDAARVQLTPRREPTETTLLIRYLVKEGHSIRLVMPQVTVVSPTLPETTHTHTIKEISSGLQWASYPEQYRVAERTFGPTDELKGLGRFKNNPQPSARDDWYDIRLSVAAFALDRFIVELPNVSTAGRVHAFKPVQFEYKEGSYPMCLQ